MTHKKSAGCTSFWSKPTRTGIKKENKRSSSKLCNISRKHKMVKQEIKEKKESMNSTSTWEVTFYCSHWRKSEEVTGQSHSWNCEWLSLTLFCQVDALWGVDTSSIAQSHLLTFCVSFLTSARHHHDHHHHHLLLTCWLWSLWVSGQRRSPEPRHTGRRASRWGCSSGSCRRFWSCPPQTLSAWRTPASVSSPPWWKGLRKGDLKNEFCQWLYQQYVTQMNEKLPRHLIANSCQRQPSHMRKQQINIWLF